MRIKKKRRENYKQLKTAIVITAFIVLVFVVLGVLVFNSAR